MPLLVPDVRTGLDRLMDARALPGIEGDFSACLINASAVVDVKPAPTGQDMSLALLQEEIEHCAAGVRWLCHLYGILHVDSADCHRQQGEQCISSCNVQAGGDINYSHAGGCHSNFCLLSSVVTWFKVTIAACGAASAQYGAHYVHLMHVTWTTFAYRSDMYHLQCPCGCWSNLLSQQCVRQTCT